MRSESSSAKGSAKRTSAKPRSDSDPIIELSCGDDSDEFEIIDAAQTVVIKFLLFAYLQTLLNREKVMAAKAGSFSVSNINTVTVYADPNNFPISLAELEKLLLDASKGSSTKFIYDPQQTNLYVADSIQMLDITSYAY